MKCPLLLAWLVMFLVFMPDLARAQTATCVSHPYEPSAVFLGSFWVDVDFGGPLNVDDCQAHVEICTWLVSGGQTDFVMNANSIYFTGECANVNSETFAGIMETLSHAAVVKGADLDYADCGDTVSVWGTSCADRSGADTTTSFESCNAEMCQRRYVIVCPPEGGITHQYLDEDNIICLIPGCETGCNDND